MQKEEIIKIIQEKAFRQRKDNIEINPQFAKYINNRIELKTYFDSLPGDSLAEKIYLLLNNKKKPFCTICKKPISFNSYTKGYYSFCSDKQCRRKNSSIWEKMQRTYEKNHGGSPFGSDKTTLEKRKKTNKEKYGTAAAASSEIVRQKLSLSKRKKEYKKIVENCLLGNMKPLFTEEEYKGVHNIYKFQCLTCGSIKKSNLIYDKATLVKNVPRCLHCNPTIQGVSRWEEEIAQFLDTLGISYIRHERKLIPPYEIDFYFPAFNFAIELNGNFWHSEIAGGKSKNYHQQKTKFLQQQNIHLCQIFQDEWIQKSELLKNYIKSNLGIWNIHIGARKCEVKTISVNESRDFLNQNHFQGFAGATKHYGLFYNDELVGVMTFGKSRFNKEYDSELLRFAIKAGYKIPGAFSKLFTFAIKENSWQKIITYADARFFTGSVYASVGFIYKNLSAPNYFYLNCNDYMTRLSRLYYQKHKLSKILKVYDSSLSEWENMKNNKYDRIWDCGNFVWSWERT